MENDPPKHQQGWNREFSGKHLLFGLGAVVLVLGLFVLVVWIGASWEEHNRDIAIKKIMEDGRAQTERIKEQSEREMRTRTPEEWAELHRHLTQDPIDEKAAEDARKEREQAARDK